MGEFWQKKPPQATAWSAIANTVKTVAKAMTIARENFLVISEPPIIRNSFPYQLMTIQTGQKFLDWFDFSSGTRPRSLNSLITTWLF
jgi:hypothetical protein